MELAYTITPLFLSVLLGHVSSARFLILVTGQRMVEEEIGRSDHRPPRVNMNFLPSMELMARQLANIRSLPRGKREETCLHEFLAQNFKRQIKKRDSSLGNDFIIRYIISKENDKSLESRNPLMINNTGWKKFISVSGGGRTKDADSMSNLSRGNKPIRRKRKRKKDKHREDQGRASIEPNWLEASFVPWAVGGSITSRRRRRRRSLNDPIFGLVHARRGRRGWERRMESKRPVLFRSAISWIGIFEGISIFPRSFEISWKLLRLTDSRGFSRNANGPPSAQSFAPLPCACTSCLFQRNGTKLL